WPRGCGVWDGRNYAEGDGCRVEVVDTVGAADGFAAAFRHGLLEGCLPVRLLNLQIGSVRGLPVFLAPFPIAIGVRCWRRLLSIRSHRGSIRTELHQLTITFDLFRN